MIKFYTDYVEYSLGEGKAVVIKSEQHEISCSALKLNVYLVSRNHLEFELI